jgi:antitoxin component of MazEF toxin-antitoxin module
MSELIQKTQVGVDGAIHLDETIAGKLGVQPGDALEVAVQDGVLVIAAASRSIDPAKRDELAARILRDRDAVFRALA